MKNRQSKNRNLQLRFWLRKNGYTQKPNFETHLEFAYLMF